MSNKGGQNSRRLIDWCPFDVWAFVDRSGGPRSCWPWARGSGRLGYGSVTADLGDGRRKHGTHAVAFYAEHGWYPNKRNGLVLRHTCDNPICCNPAHLIPGTQAQNMGDAAARDRINFGERVPWSKLSTADVVAIRREIAAGASNYRIAQAFGVNPGAILNIRAGKAWRRVPAEQPGVDVRVEAFAPQGGEA